MCASFGLVMPFMVVISNTKWINEHFSVSQSGCLPLNVYTLKIKNFSLFLVVLLIYHNLLIYQNHFDKDVDGIIQNNANLYVYRQSFLFPSLTLIKNPKTDF